MMPDHAERVAPTADDLDEGEPAWDEQLFDAEYLDVQLEDEEADE